MSERIFIIDGMAYAFRAFFAIRNALTDKKGHPTNAVYGFTRILLRILRDHEPSHVAVVFDAPGKNFRNDLYPEYKATRKPTPPELKEQFPRMHEVVKALNIALYCVPGVEADDVIGALAVEAVEKGMEAVVVSGDKDLLQLINAQTRVFDPSKGDDGKWFDREDVVERFGVGPEHVIDALALIGDAADNVPGVRGIGDKTAKKLMEQYGSLEGLYEHLDELKGKQKEKITEDREQAFFSRELVTLKLDIPLDISVEECRCKEAEPEQLTSCFTDLAFDKLLEEMVPQEAVEEAGPVDYQLLLDEAALNAAMDEMRQSGVFAVDTETTSVNPMQADLVGLSMSCEARKAYYIPLAHTAEACTIFRDPDDLSTAEQLMPIPLERALELLRPLLESPEIGKVGHNIKYDALVLQRAGVQLAGIAMDTMVASYLTDPSRLRHNLEEVSLQYLRQPMIPIKDLIGTGSKSVTFDTVPVDRACEYASEDADITWRLYEVFGPLLREHQLESLYENVEAPLLEVLQRMEFNGIAIDVALFEELREELAGRLTGLAEEIFTLAGETFTINSPKQLQKILFDKLGLKPIRKTKTGYSTDVDVLEQLSREHALPEKILNYRMLEKLRSTYVEALPKLIHPETGRIHTSYNQAVAATGRLSSSNPNLQNIPIRSELGRRIREGFIPSNPQRRLISADYSQIELRMLAHLSGDVAMRQAFEADADIHQATAAHIFEVEPEAVTADMRRQAKAVNFGVIFGMSAFGLARNLGISNKEAAEFIEGYFAQFPQVRTWQDELLVQAKDAGYVMTLLQRRRYLPDLNSTDANTRKGAERMAINTAVQGSAADVIKLAMIQLDRTLTEQYPEAKMLLQVHDELVVEANAVGAEEVAAVITQIMEDAMKLDVPIKVDAGIGNNWAEIH
jgi:DNA polymerase-1